MKKLELPILDAIEQKVVRQVQNPFLAPPIDMLDYKVSETGAGFPKMLEYDMFLRLGFRHIAPPDASEYVADMAKRSMAHHLYGPIIEQLMLLREDFFEMGVPPGSKPITRLGMILDTLMGATK